METLGLIGQVRSMFDDVVFIPRLGGLFVLSYDDWMGFPQYADYIIGEFAYGGFTHTTMTTELILYLYTYGINSTKMKMRQYRLSKKFHSA